MSLPELAFIGIGFLPSALLLASGSSISTSSAGRTSRWQAVLSVLGTALVGFAIWWPGQLQSQSIVRPERWESEHVLPLIVAALLATAARLAMSPPVRSARLLFPALAIGTWALAGWLLTLWAPDGNGSRGAGTWGTSVVIAASLLALHGRAPNSRQRRISRVLAAAIAATSLCAWLLLAVARTSPVDVLVAWPTMLTVAMISALSLVLTYGLNEAAIGCDAESDTTTQSAVAIDPLTRLPTRVNFEDELAAHAARADATQQRLALLFIDLDGFKPVNDTFGHATGDLVLQAVGERLRSLSRWKKDVVTRIGGDEFVLMVTDNPSQDDIAQIARRLIEEISRPYEVGNREVTISCSVGIVLYPEGGGHAKLIARADAAMYAAKRSGGGCYCFYAPSMDEDSRDRFELVNDLRHAIENNEMELFYQPKIDVGSGQVTGAEALLRWKHPTRGMVPPNTFIPLAERYGLMRGLGQWVIEDACRQARRWREHGLRMRVAINLSALQMRQNDIVELIVQSLERNRVQPSLLTCEITESVAMEDTKATQQTFKRLGKAGVHLSIDDFGTGYSSLSYLRRLPAEELKIDRSFVMDIESSSDARAVVDAVVKLAHALGLRVVAEGVENVRQEEILRELGCDEMQGYMFAKPMSARALLLWAIDDRSVTSTAFRESLFGDTNVEEPSAEVAASFEALNRELAESAQGGDSPLQHPS
ncbi:MAG TPA: EAL domain-containing protein [Burkholderiaceae bacterium]|nr:EAL domain-containing protein [Burkholderiaceae bacterium]